MVGKKARSSVPSKGRRVPTEKSKPVKKGKKLSSFSRDLSGLIVGDKSALPEKVEWLRNRIAQLHNLRGPCAERERKSLARIFNHLTANGDLGTGGDFNSEETTVMYEAPFDIPVANEAGATPVQRKVRVVKSATAGSATSGYYAQLFPGDLVDYVQLSSSGFKIKEVTSWSLGSEEARVAFQTTSNDELLGNSVSNYTRIGEGFCGVVTKFPMGDLPLYLVNETAAIMGHNVGSTAALKVVFDIICELLI